MKLGFLVVAMIALGTTSAFADGFVCESLDGGLKVKAFNHTSPYEGTRNAANMVISDTTVSAGRQTVARFSDVNSTLSNKGAHYSARVDLRYNDSSRKGELIAGTKLGFIQTIVLDIDFGYNHPVRSGDSVAAVLTINKRDGSVIELDLDCMRYLKN